MKLSIKQLVCMGVLTGLTCGSMSGAHAYHIVSEPVDTAEQQMIRMDMRYQDNRVTLQAGNGMTIQGGSFELKDLKITNGQDPENRNVIHQVYPLEQGVLNFQVGRQGSADVAEWFNQKFSGYNDQSVNGDRTTFDQTAGELNFAFIGDLQLHIQIPENPKEMTVTFPDVVFAQGSTMLRNNWWFGQLTGQHTRDSDGPNRMLVFGTDSDGNSVFASFLRGGNDVSTISLEALHVAQEPAEHAEKLPNVKEAFEALPINGSLVPLSGLPSTYDSTVNHVQGYTSYINAQGEAYSVLTHSVANAPYAHIVAGKKGTDTPWGFKTYRKDWRHPGGIQSIGDYLLVPSEQENQASIALYDLRALAVQELRRVETFDLAVAHKAGSLGITSYTDAGGTEYYVLMVAHLDNANTVYHVYRAPAENGLEHADFIEVGSFAMDKDFQGFGLVTEAETNDIYMIGLWSPNEGVSFADYAYLYQLDTENWKLGEELAQRHLVSDGGAPGMLGVHFRYGAGVLVTPQKQLMLSATERNTFLSGTVATNDWHA